MIEHYVDNVLFNRKISFVASGHAPEIRKTQFDRGRNRIQLYECTTSTSMPLVVAEAPTSLAVTFVCSGSFIFITKIIEGNQVAIAIYGLE